MRSKPPEKGQHTLFPTPIAVLNAPLRGLGLSSARIATLKELARAVQERDIDFTAPMDEITRALTAVPVIGSWTAQYVARRALAEPDAFLPGDLVVRRAPSCGGLDAPMPSSICGKRLKNECPRAGARMRARRMDTIEDLGEFR